MLRPIASVRIGSLLTRTSSATLTRRVPRVCTPPHRAGTSYDNSRCASTKRNARQNRRASSDDESFPSAIRFHTALTSSPQTTSLADLLSHIPPLEVPPSILKSDSLSSWRSSILVLVTPSFAKQARAAPNALHNLVSGPSNTTLDSYLTLAVVDRLPSPCLQSNASGAEGVAVLNALVPGGAGTSFLPSWRPATDSSSLEKAPLPSPSILFSFLLANPTTPYKVMHRISLTLANTTFQTGEPYTFERSHRDSLGADQRTTWSSRRLASLNVDLHHKWLVQPDPAHFRHLHLPILPLTSPRQITDSMGNIVRRLQRYDDVPFNTEPQNTNSKTKEIPASQEIESAVARYFKVRNEDPRQVALWAIVTHDPTRADIHRHRGSPMESAWSATLPDPTNFPFPDVSRGDSIARVISGGGGWGKKAGLLALDPDALEGLVANNRHCTVIPVQETCNNTLAGRYIQFFIAPELETMNDLASPLPAQESTVLQTAHGVQLSAQKLPSLTFGVIPSTIDDLPGTSTDSSTRSDSGIRVYENFFGALSESCIHLGSKVDTRYDIPRNTLPNLPSKLWTKLDVPGSQWSASLDDQGIHRLTDVERQEYGIARHEHPSQHATIFSLHPQKFPRRKRYERPAISKKFNGHINVGGAKKHQSLQ